MKRWMVTLGAMLLMPTLAMAEVEMVSISELREQVEEMGERWSQKYIDDYGREVEGDIPIYVPEVTTVPILRSVPLKISSQIKDRIKAYEGKEEHDKILSFDIQDEEKYETHLFGILSEDRFEIYHNSPTELLSYRPNDYLRTQKEEIPIEHVDERKAYTEENELTIFEVKKTLSNLLNEVYGEKVDYELGRVLIKSRARKTKGINDTELGETVDYYPKGTYVLECYQNLYGIPLLMSAKQMYSVTTDKWPSRINEFPYTVPHLWLEMMSTDKYAAGGSLESVCGILKEDVPLATIEHVVKEIGKEMKNGEIRRIYSMKLGYGMFLENEANGIYNLFPIWMVECQYAYQSEEEHQYDMSIEDYRNQLSYGRFAVNAQTGKKLSCASEIQNQNLICPEIVAWEE